MPRAIEVQTGARLHFGPLASGAKAGRCFGGIGMMISGPPISFRAVEHHEECCIGISEQTAERIRRLREAFAEPISNVASTERAKNDRLKAYPTQRRLSWEFSSTPVEHAGFGTGTQLSLAVASVLARLESPPWPTLPEIAKRSGRGLRSAIGLYGFEQGGFLVDAGQVEQGNLGELAVRIAVPESWRIVIVRPRESGPGLHGSQELAAFAALPPMDTALTDRLCRLTLMEILPALHTGDALAFGTAIAEYGLAIGNYFTPIQGGVFADPRVRELAREWPELGRRLVQSSWGPTVVAVAPSPAAAADLALEILDRCGSQNWLVEVVSPLNEGATIRECEV